MLYYEFNCPGADSWIMTEKGFIKIRDKDIISPHMMRKIDIALPKSEKEIGYICIIDMYDRKKTVWFANVDADKANEVFQELLKRDYIERFNSEGDVAEEIEVILENTAEIENERKEREEVVNAAMKATVERNSATGNDNRPKNDPPRKGVQGTASKGNGIHRTNASIIGEFTEISGALEAAGDRVFNFIVILTIIEAVASIITGIVMAAGWGEFYIFLIFLASTAVWLFAWLIIAKSVKEGFYRQALECRFKAASLRTEDAILATIAEKQ